MNPSDASCPRGEVRMSAAHATLTGDEASGLVILCDHASNALPPEYGSLGMPPHLLGRHINWDIGAEGVARALALALCAPAVFTRYSRLLIDCNRGLDDPTLIMRISDGAVIPGNRSLSDEERHRRIDMFYAPYHAEIRRVIDAGLAAGKPPVIVSIHSFIDVWSGVQRPWHCGVLWDKDPRLAETLLQGLSRCEGNIVGDNEPYTGRLRGDCLWQHGTKRGLAHAIIELRQDLIATEVGQQFWAERIAAIVGAAMRDPVRRKALQTVQHYGSHTGGIL